MLLGKLPRKLIWIIALKDLNVFLLTAANINGDS